MRVAGRQKGAKIKPYTHVVVNPNAPKSRYTFSMHSSESGAKKAAIKYSPLIGHELKVVKQSGRSPSTDMFEDIQEKNKGLWHNINQRRKSGKRMRKKGEKGAPSPEAMAQAKASSEMTTAADAGIPHDTKNMGPRIKATTMHDKRRKKDQMPVLLKRFRKYIEDNYG